MSGAQTAWWTTAFDASYAQRYAHRDDALAAQELAAIVPRLQALHGPVLDACCGAGRHLQIMRQAGLRAWGFDWSLPLLAQAAQRPQMQGAVLRGDMRQPPLACGWAAITMLFTAFGYFDEEENAATMQALVALLRADGWLIIDLAEAQRVRRDLVAQSERLLADGTRVNEQRWLDGDYVCKRSRWLAAGAWQEVEERVRLYQPCEMAILAEAAGAELQEVWPSLRGPEIDDGRQVYWIKRCH